MAKLTIKNRYGVAPNELLNSEALSLKAKGLYVLIQSKPDNWSFSALRISKQNKDGIDSIKSALKELELAGYLKRLPARDENGKWDGYDYILRAKPLKETPLVEKPSMENTPTLSKKDISNKDISKKEVEKRRKTLSPAEEMRRFLGRKEMSFALAELIVEKTGLSMNRVIKELNSFKGYWTELDKNGKKQRWEDEKHFQLKRRLTTWFHNAEKFNKPKGKKIII